MPSYDHDAIYKAYPDAATIDDSTGVFKADGSKITIVQSNVDAARVELNKLNYKSDRVVGSATTSGYPFIQDQLDQLYHDMADGKLGAAATTGSWYVGITSIKTAFPKP
tara:strand:+ start:813 stop:1139 length:327 start_codon:yes stop_codon:yes gene_type:complete